MTKAERFKGCLIGGAIGDAWGSGYENLRSNKTDVFYPFGVPEQKEPKWNITDDTQLTIATVEAMIADNEVKPESVAHQMLKYYKQRKLRGIGASTLKSLQELNVGGHWSSKTNNNEETSYTVAFCNGHNNLFSTKSQQRRRHRRYQ